MKRFGPLCALTLAAGVLLSQPAMAGDPKDDAYLPKDVTEAEFGAAQESSVGDAASQLRSGGQGSSVAPQGTVVTGSDSETTAATTATDTVNSSASENSASSGGAAVDTSKALSDNPNIVIDAVIANGAPVLQDVVSYRVERLEAGVPKEVVASYAGTEAALELPQGRYRVTATYGRTIVQDDITINAAPSSHTVNLNAGYIDLKMISHIGADPISTPIDWKILTFGKNYQGERELLHEIPNSPRTFVVLPAGWYIVQAWEGSKLTKHAIEVVPGATLKYTLVRQ